MIINKISKHQQENKSLFWFLFYKLKLTINASICKNYVIIFIL